MKIGKNYYYNAQIEMFQHRIKNNSERQTVSDQNILNFYG